MNCVEELRLHPLNSRYGMPLKDFISSALYFRMITLLAGWTEGERARLKAHRQVKRCEITQEKDGGKLNSRGGGEKKWTV